MGWRVDNGGTHYGDNCATTLRAIMRFKILRTSNAYEKPCEEALLVDASNNPPLWSIEINTLEELLALQKKYDDLIVRNIFNSTEMEIEIYDSDWDR